MGDEMRFPKLLLAVCSALLVSVPVFATEAESDAAPPGLAVDEAVEAMEFDHRFDPHRYDENGNRLDPVKLLVEGTHYWFDPAAFPGRVDLSAHPYGPQRARGLVIWNGGHNPNRGAQLKVPPIAQYFAEQGWDVYNLMRHTILAGEGFDRTGTHIGNKIEHLLLRTIERAEAMGYQRIVIMGVSRGGFAVIAAGRYRARVHGILALAPANYGHYELSKNNEWLNNHGVIAEMWTHYKASKVLVGAGYFAGDLWYESRYPGQRAVTARETLGRLGVPHFIIDAPAFPWMQGHGGGVTWNFARRYGPCLEAFYDTGSAPLCADGDIRSLAVFGLPVPKSVARAQDGFSGFWQGTWSSGRFATLEIRPGKEGRHDVVYRLGKGVNGDKPETNRWSLEIKDGQMQRDSGKVRFQFQPGPDDTLLTTRINGQGETRSITWRRLALPS
jgi:dienelactone hydrolase